jgi:hypothetical protein
MRAHKIAAPYLLHVCFPGQKCMHGCPMVMEHAARVNASTLWFQPPILSLSLSLSLECSSKGPMHMLMHVQM